MLPNMTTPTWRLEVWQLAHLQPFLLALYQQQFNLLLGTEKHHNQAKRMPQSSS